MTTSTIPWNENSVVCAMHYLGYRHSKTIPGTVGMTTNVVDTKIRSCFTSTKNVRWTPRRVLLYSRRCIYRIHSCIEFPTPCTTDHPVINVSLWMLYRWDWLVADFAGPEVHALLERSSPGPETFQPSAQLQLRTQGQKQIRGVVS